jgi:hypothetical protein
VLVYIECLHSSQMCQGLCYVGSHVVTAVTASSTQRPVAAVTGEIHPVCAAALLLETMVWCRCQKPKRAVSVSVAK